MGTYGIISAGIIGACMAIIIWWQHGELEEIRESLSVWRQTAITNASSVMAMESDREQLEQALRQRELDLNTIREGLEEQRKLLNKAVQDDQAVAEWGATSLPSAVFDVVCVKPTSDTDSVSKGKSTKASTAKNSGAANKRKNKR